MLFIFNLLKKNTVQGRVFCAQNVNQKNYEKNFLFIYLLLLFLLCNTKKKNWNNCKQLHFCCSCCLLNWQSRHRSHKIAHNCNIADKIESETCAMFELCLVIKYIYMNFFVKINTQKINWKYWISTAKNMHTHAFAQHTEGGGLNIFIFSLIAKYVNSFRMSPFHLISQILSLWSSKKNRNAISYRLVNWMNFCSLSRCYGYLVFFFLNGTERHSLVAYKIITFQ